MAQESVAPKTEEELIEAVRMKAREINGLVSRLAGFGVSCEAELYQPGSVASRTAGMFIHVKFYKEL